jgi:hypothetical protein
MKYDLVNSYLLISYQRTPLVLLVDGITGREYVHMLNPAIQFRLSLIRQHSLLLLRMSAPPPPVDETNLASAIVTLCANSC